MDGQDEAVPVWEQQLSGMWVAFKDDCQPYLEKTYQAFRQGVGDARRLVTTTDDDGSLLKLSLDFGMLSSKTAGRSTDILPIRRREAVEAAAPALAIFHIGEAAAGQHDQRTLLESWCTEPRVETVTLADGRLVQGFKELELYGAQCNGELVQVCLSTSNMGSVLMPAELDGNPDAPITDFGSDLTSPDEIDKLADEDNQQCKICLCDLEREDHCFKLLCGHAFHGECIGNWFARKRRCPACTRSYGKLYGSQPLQGIMEWHPEITELEVHPRAAQAIVLQFKFPAGTDEDGQEYIAREPWCYLPDDAAGLVLLELYKVAFRRRVMFGFGPRLRDGAFGATFNIHIKTRTHGGSVGHGYPDDAYFLRSLEELRSNGVTISDLPLQS